MASISIERSHDLTHAKLVAIADKMTKELEAEFGMASAWVGRDRVKVKGGGVTGELHLLPHALKIEIHLGLLAGMFADRIRDGVERKLDALLKPRAARKK